MLSGFVITSVSDSDGHEGPADEFQLQHVGLGGSDSDAFRLIGLLCQVLYTAPPIAFRTRRQERTLAGLEAKDVYIARNRDTGNVDTKTYNLDAETYNSYFDIDAFEYDTSTKRIDKGLLQNCLLFGASEER